MGWKYQLEVYFVKKKHSFTVWQKQHDLKLRYIFATYWLWTFPHLGWSLLISSDQNAGTNRIQTQLDMELDTAFGYGNPQP